MSLETPTTATVSANILAQLETALSETIPLLPKAFARVLAKALGGTFILLYKYAGFLFLQMFVSTASYKQTVVNGRTIVPLIEWGRLIGVGDPEAATRAELVVEVTVLVQTGSLPAGSQLLYAPTGIIYTTSASVALDAPTVEVKIRAASDQQGGSGEGSIGNLDPGTVLSFASPLANVARDVEVLSQTVTGADGESEDAYRARVLGRFQRKPQGGAYADYQQWGLEAAGILAIYPYTSVPPSWPDIPGGWPIINPGEVNVFVEATVESSGSPDGIPTGAQLTAVNDLIQMDDDGLASRRPSGAAVNVYAISRTAFDVFVEGLDPNTAENRSAIEAAADEYLRSREPFIIGLSLLPRRDLITRAAVASAMEEAAESLGATIVEVALAGLPHTLGAGEKAKLGAVTYT